MTLPDPPSRVRCPMTETYETKPNWGTQSGRRNTYSPGEFYCRSTNEFNHHEKIRAYPRDVDTMPEFVTAPPHIVGGVNEMIASPLTPYRTQHDFIRDAIVHRLKTLEILIPDNNLTERLNLEVITQGHLKRQVEQKQLIATIASLDTEVETYYAENNHLGIQDVLDDAHSITVPRHFQRQWDEAIDRWEQRLATAR